MPNGPKTEWGNDANQHTALAESYGWKCTCHFAPVQYEGKTPDGMCWFFSSRWSHGFLGVGATHDNAIDGTLYLVELGFDRETEGSWLDHGRAGWIIAMGLEAYGRQ